MNYIIIFNVYLLLWYKKLCIFVEILVKINIIYNKLKILLYVILK